MNFGNIVKILILNLYSQFMSRDEKVEYQKKELVYPNQYVKDWIIANAGERSRAQYLLYYLKAADFLSKRGMNLHSIVNEWKDAKYNNIDRTAELRFIDTWQSHINAYRADILNLPEEKLSIGTKKNRLAVLKGFLTEYDIPLKLKLPDQVWIKYHKKNLTPQEVKKILNAVPSKRDFAIFMLQKDSGIRPETVTQLRFKDIREEFEAGKDPMMIDLRAEILKYHVSGHFSFIGSEAIGALREYLQSREEKLEDEDLIFQSNKPLLVNYTKRSNFSSASLSKIFNNAVRKAGLHKSNNGKPTKISQYCLRHYFRNKHSAEESWKFFWMAHNFRDSNDSSYKTTDVEEHRKAYAEGYDSLRILEPTTNPQQTQQIQKIQQQLEKKDQEMKELKAQNERFSARLDQLAEPLETLKQLNLKEFEDLSKKQNLSTVEIMIQFIRLQTAKQLNDEVQKLKKKEAREGNEK